MTSRILAKLLIPTAGVSIEGPGLLGVALAIAMAWGMAGPNVFDLQAPWPYTRPPRLHYCGRAGGLPGADGRRRFSHPFCTFNSNDSGPPQPTRSLTVNT